MSPNPNPPPDDDPALRETLKRCSPATYYAACKLRANKADTEALRIMVIGVVERFVERDLRPKLQEAPEVVNALRLTPDLGLDSLTMMEIVMLAEEVLPIDVSNEELTRLGTVGDVQQFVLRKLQERPDSPKPHRPETTADWNIAAVGEQVRRIEATGATAPLTRFPEQRPNHA